MRLPHSFDRDFDTKLLERHLGLRPLFFALLGLAATGGFIWAGLHFLPAEFVSEEGLQVLRREILSYGALTPLIFCLLYGLRAVIYLPEPLLMALAGFLVGPFWAVPLIVAGCTWASTLVFLIARCMKILARNFSWAKRLALLVEKNFGAGRSKVERLGYRTLWILRTLPIFPFTPMAYGASLIMNLSYRRYITAMGIGVIPPALFYSSVACIFLNLDDIKTPTSNYWQFTAVGAAMVFWLGLVGFLLHLARRRFRKKLKTSKAVPL